MLLSDNIEFAQLPWGGVINDHFVALSEAIMMVIDELINLSNVSRNSGIQLPDFHFSGISLFRMSPLAAIASSIAQDM
jgi:hypothetical protein